MSGLTAILPFDALHRLIFSKLKPTAFNTWLFQTRDYPARHFYSANIMTGKYFRFVILKKGGEWKDVIAPEVINALRLKAVWIINNREMERFKTKFLETKETHHDSYTY